VVTKPRTVREAREFFDARRRAFATARIDLANRQSEYDYALSIYLTKISETPVFTRTSKEEEEI
jgi:hypothetical protein